MHTHTRTGTRVHVRADHTHSQAQMYTQPRTPTRTMHPHACAQARTDSLTRAVCVHTALYTRAPGAESGRRAWGPRRVTRPAEADKSREGRAPCDIMSQGGRLLTQPGPAPGGGRGTPGEGAAWPRSGVGPRACGREARLAGCSQLVTSRSWANGWGGGGLSQRPAATAAPGPAWPLEQDANERGGERPLAGDGPSRR